MIFTMNLNLSDWTELVFLSASDHVLSSTCDQLKNLRPKKKRSASFIVEKLRFRLVETGFVHHKPVSDGEIKVALQNFAQEDLQISTKKLV